MTNKLKDLYLDAIINNKKSIDLCCEQCNKIFVRNKSDISVAFKKGLNHCFCSQECFVKSETKRTEKICGQCGKPFIRGQVTKSKSGKNFCSRSCSVTYNNTHKRQGTRRSKLEIWLELMLSKIYSNLEIHYTRKDAINSELDIYIPSINLAFELNGIFHYEPIYGVEKLSKIQNNDARKFQACIENNIELCIIDTSQLIHFNPKRAQKYLDIITHIINNKQVIEG